MKSKIDHLTDIMEAQEAKIIACDIDLTIYNRKLIIVTDSKETAYFNQKVNELKAIKARAEETIEVIKNMIAGDKKEKTDKILN
jgi:protein associated with RNAse G/E